MIKAVIFDMYETLITQHKGPMYFRWEMAADAGLSVEEFSVIYNETERGRSTGLYTMEEVVDRILRSCGVYTPELAGLLCSKRLESKREHFRRMDPDIIPMLDRLKEDGYKIALITNCYSEEVTAIKESILWPYFDAVCMSYEEGTVKPDQEIYRRCIKRLGVKPEECLYVGDGGSHELDGARDAGMHPLQALWYMGLGGHQPTKRIAEYPCARRPFEVADCAAALSK